MGSRLRKRQVQGFNRWGRNVVGERVPTGRDVPAFSAVGVDDAHGSVSVVSECHAHAPVQSACVEIGVGKVPRRGVFRLDRVLFGSQLRGFDAVFVVEVGWAVCWVGVDRGGVVCGLDPDGLGVLPWLLVVQ